MTAPLCCWSATITKRRPIALITLLVATIFCATPAAAHGDHDHGVTSQSVIDLAARYIPTLIQSKTPIEGEVLDASWQEIAQSEMAIAREASWYFIVKIHHQKQSRDLYLLLSRGGVLFRANFSGTFDDLD